MYFQNKIEQWKTSVQEWQASAYDADQALQPLKIRLEECESQPDTTTLTQQLLECRNRCPQTELEVADPTPIPRAEYQDWPEFLHPNANGTIQVVKQYLLSGVVDLNALKIVSYGKPFWSQSEAPWKMDVEVHGRSSDGEYRINTFHFVFMKNGGIDEVTETINQ